MKERLLQGLRLSDIVELLPLPAGDRSLGQGRPPHEVLRPKRARGRARRLVRRLGRRQQVSVAPLVRELLQSAADADRRVGALRAPGAPPASTRLGVRRAPAGRGACTARTSWCRMQDPGRLLLHDASSTLVEEARRARNLRLQDASRASASRATRRAIRKAAGRPSRRWRALRAACSARTASDCAARALAIARRPNAASPTCEAHNLEYLDDGQENIIDDYCALLAASELYAARRRSRAT